MPRLQELDRRAARWTGIYFIIATALLFVGQALYKPVLDATDILAAVQAQKTRFLAGVLFEFFCVLAIPMIAVSIYPILRRHSGAVAMAYLVFRVLEAVLIIGVSHVNMLALITLGDSATGSDTAMAVLNAQTAWARAEGPAYNLVFVIGTLILNVALFRTRLVPHALSVLGIAAALAIGFAVLISIFVDLPTIWAVLLVTPIAVQEMLLALWLITRGVDTARLSQTYSAATFESPSIGAR